LAFVSEMIRDGTLHRNFGTRLFNVAGALSNLTENAGRDHALVTIANYTDYPIEQVTVDVLGSYRNSRLLRPGLPPLSIAAE
jgi:hypothetical protein